MWACCVVLVEEGGCTRLLEGLSSEGTAVARRRAHSSRFLRSDRHYTAAVQLRHAPLWKRAVVSSATAVASEASSALSWILESVLDCLFASGYCGRALLLYLSPSTAASGPEGPAWRGCARRRLHSLRQLRACRVSHTILNVWLDCYDARPTSDVRCLQVSMLTRIGGTKIRQPVRK